MSDLIRRQDAIDAVADGLKHTFVEYRDIAEKMINKLPSAQPTQDCISRQAAIQVASGYCHPANIAKELAKLPSVQPDHTMQCNFCSMSICTLEGRPYSRKVVKE